MNEPDVVARKKALWPMFNWIGPGLLLTVMWWVLWRYENWPELKDRWRWLCLSFPLPIAYAGLILHLSLSEKWKSWWAELGWGSKILLAATGGVVLEYFFLLNFRGFWPTRFWQGDLPWVFISGLATVPTLLLLWYWRDLHKRADVEKGRADIKIAQEGQITDRFATAVRLLGDEKLEVRLGGTYALERIAKDSKRDHWTVMESLAAFVREKMPRPQTNELQNSPDSEISRPPTDIQAALTVIGRRPPDRIPEEPARIDLSRTDLRGAVLNEAHLERANLWEADLTRSNLASAHLEESIIVDAHLKGAFLRDVHFEGANLSRANFVEANLRLAHFDRAILEDCHLEGANLWRADLDGAGLTDAHYSEETYFSPEWEPKRRGRAGMVLVCAQCGFDFNQSETEACPKCLRVPTCRGQPFKPSTKRVVVSEAATKPAKPISDGSVDSEEPIGG